MEEKKFHNSKLLRYGYTTGSCAAAAAKAAAQMLRTGQPVSQVRIVTPSGVPLTLDVLDPVLGEDSASCAIRKDGGDDPDATSGLLIYATVRPIPQGIRVDGGPGVGRVTKPGLDQPVGAAAINHVPRQMIEAAVAEALQGASGGMEVIISVPGGEEVGKRTFNPHLGIVGGISILGTSGIVEPMSEQALVDTTRVELNMCRAGGATDLLLTVGNYGDDFASCKLGLSLAGRIKCSNFIGQTLSDAISLGFRRVLLIGHIGKLVKLGAGIMNTHSAQGDARMEILVSCALARGASLEALRAVAACITTEAALEELRRFGLLEETMKELGERIGQQLDRRFGRFLELGVLVFSGQKEAGEILCRCGRVEAFLEEWRRNP
ncbi:MAG: cobalt-precorrin-5B (C(1))-methyltransferase CbiD [Oscillospiraceae bacterium]